MTLQELRFIVTLAREKHFGKASAACFVSQPTLSIAVKKLEESLGVILFERNKNQVQVTPIGERIVEQAQRVLEETELLKQVAQSDKDQFFNDPPTTEIYTVGPYILPPLIKQLHKLAPTLSLEIKEDFTSNLREKLRHGDVDAIIISLPFTEPGLVIDELYRESFAVLMPGDHPLTYSKTVHEKDLLNYDMLLLEERHCFRDQVMSSCPSCFSALKADKSQHWRTVDGHSLETVRHMVASGMGLSIVPMTAGLTEACPYDEKYLTWRPLRGNDPHRVVALAWRKSFPRVKAIEVLRKAISKCNLPGAKK